MTYQKSTPAMPEKDSKKPRAGGCEAAATTPPHAATSTTGRNRQNNVMFWAHNMGERVCRG